MIDLLGLDLQAPVFYNPAPFDHCVIDNFLPEEIAKQASADFPSYNDPEWYCYDDARQNKKSLNNWYRFPPTTYSIFSYLCSPEWCNKLGKSIGKELLADYGLHGGGWHIHGVGGDLNPHLDYSLHPKLGLQRKLNIIVYLTPDWQPEWNGALGLWEAKGNAPDKLLKEVVPQFNRAVIFDTTQNSWHGMSKPLALPPDHYRKSIAVYYLCTPSANPDQRTQAFFSLRGAK